jgi:feruloyl esterase
MRSTGVTWFGRARSTIILCAASIAALFPAQFGNADARHPADASIALADVPAKIDCASLGGLDLSAIGGAGSRVTSAKETVGAQESRVCAVEGILAPAIRFRVELPVKTWTQRFL